MTTTTTWTTKTQTKTAKSKKRTVTTTTKTSTTTRVVDGADEVAEWREEHLGSGGTGTGSAADPVSRRDPEGPGDNSRG
ncbi:MAG: hypothetical protein ACYCXY_09275 [Acidimicrobiales bacterium]